MISSIYSQGMLYAFLHVTYVILYITLTLGKHFCYINSTFTNTFNLEILSS